MLAQNIAPKPAALPPAPQAAAQPPQAAGPSFAQFLTSQAPPPAPPEADNAADEASSAQAAARRRPAQPAKPAQQRPAEAAPKAEAKAPADKTDAETTTDAVTACADEDDTADTPELKEFTQLLGMTTAQPEALARNDTHRSRNAAASDDDAPTGRTGTRGVAADGGRGPVEAAAAAPARAGDLRADAGKAARADTEALQTAAASQPASEPAPATPAPASPSFAAVLAQALPAPAATANAAPATAYAGVQAPLHSQAFAPELGARVSLLAVDGVQQAQLQLNPADMGPVSVQITVDGNQAQVSFHAVQAETRQALEQSLPDLAAALQGQGLTLAGGGVFQQAPRDAEQRGEPADDGGTARGSRAGGGRIDATATPATPPARRSVGLLDTFA
ncbi:flagellar hook-length control protein FliK [Roseateles sp. DXS20W]|uniref:Flagellar hook-length control protein FliK n=1 Tax=Pelomonas lactea TaxID=3299030 RepID=A0ABW7GIS7_9BURK